MNIQHDKNNFMGEMAQIHHISGKKNSHITKTISYFSIGCQMINVLGLCLNTHMEEFHFNILITKLK
jgi:hypothetical protein